MPYTVTKHITARNKNPFRGMVNVMIVLVAIPVAAIALICLLLYLAFMWIKGRFTPPGRDPEPYRQELALLRNSHVTVTLVEDERDLELTQLNEAWMEHVYDEETCLFRAATVPRIAALDGKICCFYLMEKPDGAILQVLHPLPAAGQELNTQLVLLQYPDLHITTIADVGPFHLYHEETDKQLIKGFNRRENILIELKAV